MNFLVSILLQKVIHLKNYELSDTCLNILDKILNKIKEPSPTCKFYCEHIIEELNGKENYNGCE